MDGWIGLDGWMDGLDGCMDGRMDSWVVGFLDGWMDKDSNAIVPPLHHC